jgi:hypothetical protein
MSEDYLEANRRMREMMVYRDPGFVPAAPLILSGQSAVNDADPADFSANVAVLNPWAPRTEGDNRMDFSGSDEMQEAALANPLAQLFSAPPSDAPPTEEAQRYFRDEILKSLRSDDAFEVESVTGTDRDESAALTKAAPQATAEPQAQAEQVNPDTYCEDDLIAAVLAVEPQGQNEHEQAFFNRVDGWLLENNRPLIFTRPVA